MASNVFAVDVFGERHRPTFSVMGEQLEMLYLLDALAGAAGALDGKM